MKYLVLIFIFLLSLISCKNSSNNDNSTKITPEFKRVLEEISASNKAYKKMLKEAYDTELSLAENIVLKDKINLILNKEVPLYSNEYINRIKIESIGKYSKNNKKKIFIIDPADETERSCYRTDFFYLDNNLKRISKNQTKNKIRIRTKSYWSFRWIFSTSFSMGDKKNNDDGRLYFLRKKNFDIIIMKGYRNHADWNSCFITIYSLKLNKLDSWISEGNNPDEDTFLKITTNPAKFIKCNNQDDCKIIVPK